MQQNKITFFYNYFQFCIYKLNITAIKIFVYIIYKFVSFIKFIFYIQKKSMMRIYKKII